MNLVAISINHRSAPLELREALHLSKNEIIELIEKLKETFSEGAIISTCNRTELFLMPKDNLIHPNFIINKLTAFKNINGGNPEHYTKFFSCGAVKHLFSVASGIDSLLIGDSQILGQVKESFELSDDLKFIGPITRRIFENALRVGKRSIKETSIGEGAITVSYAAVQLVEKIFSNLEKKSALIIGAGETGELAAVNLKDKGIGKIFITNRTQSKAESLASKLNGDVLSFDNFKKRLNEFDIIISATSSENYILEFSDINDAVKKRGGMPIVIMDIAIPRDIDPKVKKLDSVFYHDMDSLKIIVDQNLNKRKSEIPLVEKIIMEEMISFFGWYNSLGIVPTIKSLRDFFDEIKTDELDKLKNKINSEDYQKVEDMTRRMLGRILHNPTKKLREIAESGTNVQEITTNTILLSELFNLNKSENNRDGSS